MIRKIGNHIFCRILVMLTLINFINLSADFYTSINRSINLLDDPIDTVAEIVLEYFMEMDQETIPDTDVPQEQRKFKDLKLFHTFFQHENKINILIYYFWNGFYINLFESLKIELLSPPPKN